MRMMLILLILLVAGCTAAPKALTAEQRHAKYAELGDHLGGIPYVIGWGVDDRQDKLVIDVGTQEARRAVEQAVGNVGLPRDAVIINQPAQVLTEAAPFAGCQAEAPQSTTGAGLRLSPEAMRPGQLFRLTVEAGDAEIMRGVDSYLECWDGKDWSTRYMLQVGWGSTGAKPTARIFPGGAVVTLGLPGPGPEELVLPPNIPPGWYRIRKQVSVGNAQQTLTQVFQVR